MPPEVAEAPADVVAPVAPSAETQADPQEPIAQEGEPVSPEPEQPEGEFDLKGFFKEYVKDPESAKALIEALPDEIQASLFDEAERRGEQRVQTRKRETDTATDRRHELYRTVQSTGTTAMQSLGARLQRAAAGDYDSLDMRTMAEEIDAFRNAGIAEVALANETTIGQLREQFLPEPTADESRELEPLVYKDAINGTFEQLGTLIEKVAAREYARGKAEGMAAGEKKLNSSKDLADQLKRVVEARQQSPGVMPKPGVGAGGLTLASYNAMTAEQRAALTAEEKDRMSRMAMGLGG